MTNPADSATPTATDAAAASTADSAAGSEAARPDSPRNPDRVLVLPAAEELAGTAHQEARKGPETLVGQIGGTVVDVSEDSPYGDGSATAVVVVKPIPADRLQEALEANPQVGWVQLPFAGIENYVPFIRSREDVRWTSAKGIYAPPVAEHALLLTLALLRHLPERVRATSWGTPAGTTLNGLHCVVVGGGGIARESVRLLKTWSTTVTAVRRSSAEVPGADRTVRVEQLDEVLPEAAVVIIAAASTPETHGMIGARQLELMDTDAVLVNIARGTLVDTDALVEALAEGRIRAAGLDVTEPEPLPDGHPLWDEPRALITPHTADTAAMCIPLLNERIESNLHHRVSGEQLEGLVDLEGGY